MTPGQSGEDDQREGFSERFAKQEPLPCKRCWGKGFFHWPLLADHEPTPVETNGEKP